MTKIRLVVAGILGFTACGALAAEQAPMKMSIDPQPLDRAINSWAAQTGYQVLMPADYADDRDAATVRGTYTPEDSLRILLAHTKFEPRFINSRTVAIRLADSDPSGEPQPPGDSPAPSGASGDADSEGKADRGNISVVVVTAQKREERLQDVPISISVLGGAELDTSTGESLNDVISQVPGVYSYDTGQNGGTKFAIRGVTSNTSLFSGSGTAGYYLDEVPFGFVRIPVTPDANAYDMERVEVLRGPQGTLYGANSVNGVIRIMTRDANLDKFEMKARGSFSSTEEGSGNYRADTAINVPLVSGKLALRTVVGYTKYSGWLDQPGQTDVNDVEQKVLRLKLNASPSDNTDLELMAWFNRDDRGGPSIGPTEYVSYGVGDQPITTDYDIYGLTAQHDFGSFSILSASNYMIYQNDGLLSIANGAAFQLTRIRSRLFSEEIRLNSIHEGPWQWSVGGMFRDARDDQFNRVNQNPPLNDVYESESYALFGELRRSFADGRFELTGGARYFHDQVDLEQRSALNVGVPANPIVEEEKFDSLTPRVVLTWHLNDDLNVYTSFSQGFRSGFMQAPLVLQIAPAARPVEEDLLTNYEIGAKGGLADGRVRYDIAAFYIDWKDSQQQVFAPIGQGLNQAVPFNSGGISGPGFDVELNVELIDNLNLAVAASWNGLGFDDEVRSPANNAVIFMKDERPDESPETTARIGLEYDTPFGSGGFSGRFGTSANYASATTSHNSTTGLEVQGDSYLLVHARIALVSPYNWVTTLYGENLTNENPVVRPVATGPAFSSRIRPRTVGLQFEYNF